MEYIDVFKDIEIIALRESKKLKTVPMIEFYQADEIFFDPKSEYHIDNKILRLVNYDGGLGFPKHVAIEMDDDMVTYINGFLGSPAIIQGIGDVNLMIDKDIELIVRSIEPTKLDGQMLLPDEEEMFNYAYGRDFAEIKRKFYSGQEFTPPKLFINSGEKSKFARFKSEMNYLPEIYMCRKENVIYVEKFEGAINLYYHADIEQEHVGDDPEGLTERLKKAIDEEKYEEAQKLQKKLNRILKNPSDKRLNP